jgi:hypothetical protein
VVYARYLVFNFSAVRFSRVKLIEKESKNPKKEV